MIICEKIKNLTQRQDLVYWAASVGANKIPDLIRASGFNIEDAEHLTFFLPQKLFDIIEPGLKNNLKITFLITSIKNLESYQIKGEYKYHHKCTEENIESYRLNVLSIIDQLNEMGMGGNGIMDCLLEQPSVAVTLHCSETFEQTPKPGTGNKITDEDHE